MRRVRNRAGVTQETATQETRLREVFSLSEGRNSDKGEGQPVGKGNTDPNGWDRRDGLWWGPCWAGAESPCW